MAQYTTQDRVFLRMAMGFSATYRQQDPRLENAITATQSEADGGSQPDNTTQLYILSLVYGQATVVGPPAIPAKLGILSYRSMIDTQATFLGASSADGGEVKIDPYRETARLKQEGRRLCNELATMLGAVGVRADMFGNPAIIKTDNPFIGVSNWTAG